MTPPLIGGYPMNPFPVLPVLITKLYHQPVFPVQGPEIQVYCGQKVYDKQVGGHKGSQPDYDHPREQKGVPYPPVNASNIQNPHILSE